MHDAQPHANGDARVMIDLQKRWLLFFPHQNPRINKFVKLGNVEYNGPWTKAGFVPESTIGIAVGVECAVRHGVLESNDPCVPCHNRREDGQCQVVDGDSIAECR